MAICKEGKLFGFIMKIVADLMEKKQFFHPLRI